MKELLMRIILFFFSPADVRVKNFEFSMHAAVGTFHLLFSFFSPKLKSSLNKSFNLNLKNFQRKQFSSFLKTHLNQSL